MLEIYEMFSWNGEGQQIYQLSKILSADLANTVLSFSGAQDGAAKAVRYLNNRFNSPHLLLPKVYDEIRECPQAHNQSQVPRIAEKLLRHVESISALRGDDKSPLPADVTQTIFQA